MESSTEQAKRHSTTVEIEPAPVTEANLEHKESGSRHHSLGLPRYNHNGHLVTRGIHPDGESGRGGIHPWMFLKVCFRSSSTISKWVNLLWPFVPAAIAMNYAAPNLHYWIFALNYIAMVPSANLIGFAGQELARKLPKVFGVILETFLGSIVEIVLFMVLLTSDKENSYNIPVIKAAILGSVLANLLLCLGTCFFVGGMRMEKQKFDGAISEVGSGLLLTAGFGLSIPRAFIIGVQGNASTISADALSTLVLKISRSTAIMLLIAFVIYIWFQLRTHHGVYFDILEEDEKRDRDRQEDLAKHKLTFTECFIALGLAIAFVSLHAIFLVGQIAPIINSNGVSDMFMGLILVPLVEKLAEHLTAVDEAFDDQMNFALAHVLGATLQTALLNSSLVVLVGWGLGKDMDLDFETFQVVLLILAILVVGNFLRDGESNYLEGALCVIIYVIIAVATFYYPNETQASQTGEPANMGNLGVKRY